MKRMILILSLMAGMSAFAQESWTLKKCIDYALENNLQLKQQEIATNYQRTQLNQAKNDRLPGLNAQLGNNYNYGRSLTFENTYENANSMSVTGYMGSEITLWNGFQLKNIIRQRDLDLKAAIQDKEKTRNDLILNIAALYLEVLFAEELTSVDERQLEITRQQLERTRNLVNAGSLARGSQLEVEAQMASEELQLVNDQNNLQLAYLSLYQLLELPVEKSFKIVKPSFPELNTGTMSVNSFEIFRNAVQTRPEILASQLRLESAHYQLEQIKGARWPKVSFGANYYNNYNDNFANPLDRKVIPFSRQLKNNDRYGFGVTMNIPVFNHFQVRNSISNAQLQVEEYEYKLQNARNILRKDIEQAYANALASLKKYISGEKAVKSGAEAFRYTEEKFSVGMITPVEYNQVKNNLAAAESQLTQAKYEYIFRMKILDFYNGIPIQL